VGPISVENVHHYLAKVETDAERILGSYGPKEHDACVAMKLPNDGRLNRVFKQMRVAYTPCPMSGTDAFAVGTRKQKADASGKVATKRQRCPWRRRWG
jgi:hypothetical protein